MDDDNPHPPCRGRDEWTRESGYDGANVGNPHAQLLERAATTYAQAVCMACPARRECMETALDFESQEGEIGSYWVWGGYRGYERARVLDDQLPDLVPPASRDAWSVDTREAFMDLFRRCDGDVIGFAADRGLKVKTVLDRATAYIWQLRVEEGDPWLVLHEQSVSATPVDASSHEASDSVRAA